MEVLSFICTYFMSLDVSTILITYRTPVVSQEGKDQVILCLMSGRSTMVSVNLSGF